MVNGPFVDAAARIEAAIAFFLEFAATTGDTGFIERITRLAIKKEIVLGLLLDEIGDISPFCPPATLPNEPPECEQRRQDVSGDVFNAANGFQIGFVNQLMDFNDTTDPLNPFSCEGAFVGGFHLAPVEELVVPAVRDTVTEILQPGCSVLVWTTINGIPTLAYILPGSPDFIEIVPTPSLSCLAYHICINSGA